MKLNLKNLLKSLLFLLVLSTIGCKSKQKLNKDFNYFQHGADSGKAILKYEFKEPLLRVNDLITVQVIAGSVRQEDAVLFNIVSGASGGGGAQSNTSGSGSQLQIDANGFIELPKIGKVKAAGLTKKQLEENIKLKLVDEVKNPVVVVKLAQFKVNILGEVRHPGVVLIKNDKVTLLDAIAEAGDLSETGKREDILLMRENEGKYETYKIDLRNTDFINTPAYQLAQNDIIYVGANLTKLKNLQNQENSFFIRNFSIILTSINALILILSTLGVLKRN